MHIYKPDQPTDHLVFVSPAATPQGRECADWMDGEEPRTFRVAFRGGRADVPDNLGRYMIDTGQARLSPVILPSDIWGTP